MDRRQKKTRKEIFKACTELLSQKRFHQITVGEIIEKADIGRATFYAHFETKDFLLKELCEDLFCHIFDEAGCGHTHMFKCEDPDSVFLHLFRHLLKNDNHILELLSCPSNDLFLQYFKEHLRKLAVSQLDAFKKRKSPSLPDSFWINHIASVFVETVLWWIDNGMNENPETIAEYFYLAV